MIEKKIIKNLKKCPSFGKCNKNKCPLDHEINKRVYLGGSEWCKWTKMNYPRKKVLTLNGVETVVESGHSIMPPEVFKYVPVNNYPYLNNSTFNHYLYNN